MTKKNTSSKKSSSKVPTSISKVTKKAAVKKNSMKKPLKKATPAPLKRPSKAPVKKVTKKIIAKKPPLRAQPLKKKITPKIMAKKPSPKKPISKIPREEKVVLAKKTVIRQRASKPAPQSTGVLRQMFVTKPKTKNGPKLSPFFEKQRMRLLLLKDTLLDSMKGVARDNLHAGSDASAFGMHQADAGSDAYDRDFALSILSQEQNSLYEIDEALKRIDDGTYGVCEVSNKTIPRARLEARPFTRYTVECQADFEKRQHFSGARLAVSSLFGLTEEETENEDEENIIENTKD